jgi:hypothetical protein
MVGGMVQSFTTAYNANATNTNMTVVFTIAPSAAQPKLSSGPAETMRPPLD